MKVTNLLPLVSGFLGVLVVFVLVVVVLVAFVLVVVVLVVVVLMVVVLMVERHIFVKHGTFFSDGPVHCFPPFSALTMIVLVNFI